LCWNKPNVFSAMSEILRSTTDKATMFHPFYLCMHVTFWHSYQIQYPWSWGRIMVTQEGFNQI
jgi:hypothetical protein